MKNQISQNLFKANELIFAKYSVDSILENRILALVLLAVQNNDYTESENHNLIISFSIKTLLDYCNVKGNKYSQLIDELKESLQSRWIGFTDYENKAFCYKALFIGAALKNGILTLSINGELRKYLIGITSRGNYTPLSLYTLMSLKSNYSVRLYEILRKSCYSNANTNKYTSSINLTELKLMLGVYKIDKKNKEVKKELEKGMYTNFSYIETFYSDNYYNSFRRFNEKILSKAIDEINLKSDIIVEFKQLKENKGGKTTSLLFTCRFKKDAKAEGEIIKKLEDSTVNFAKDIFSDLKLTDEEYEAISRTSGYSSSKLVEIRKIYDANVGKIERPVAWILAAIKNNYSPATVSKKQQKTSFNNFNSRDYDYEELAKEIMI